MAMGKAIVSTTVGCEGIDATDGDTIAIADDPQHFADRVLALLEDPASASAMGRRGRSHVLRQYAWGAIVARIADAYARASATRAAHPHAAPPVS
jgi:glycosyltransferase involved in cell wall biosynthesis